MWQKTADVLALAFVPQSFLRQVHSLFQSDFATECDLVPPLSIYSVFSFPYSFLRLLPRRTVTSILPSTFSSITCFRRKFLRKIYACLYMDGDYLIVFSSLLSCNVPENWYSRLREHTGQSVGHKYSGWKIRQTLLSATVHLSISCFLFEFLAVV
jgi:hypothetical protein